MRFGGRGGGTAGACRKGILRDGYVYARCNRTEVGRGGEARGSARANAGHPLKGRLVGRACGGLERGGKDVRDILKNPVHVWQGSRQRVPEALAQDRGLYFTGSTTTHGTWVHGTVHARARDRIVSFSLLVVDAEAACRDKNVWIHALLFSPRIVVHSTKNASSKQR